MSGKQISMFKSLPEQELQSYVTQLQAVKNASNGLFNSEIAKQYAATIKDVEASQAALLLSTQGLTNAQIAETLAVNGATTADTYKAMAEAGLLKSKQKLTAAEIQENLQTVLGAEADTSAAMKSLGLSAAIEGQTNQTIKLSAAKLKEAVDTGVLTEAQAQELAMRTGVIFSMEKQAATTLPRWIATLRACTLAIWDQIKATAVWLVTTPAGWATMAIAAIGGVILWLNKLAKTRKEVSDKAQEDYKKSKERIETNKQEAESLENLIEKYKELKSSSNIDSETRDEIKDIQYDIVDLVGAEAKGLDLVNGKLDDQLKTLKGITVEKAKQNLEDAKSAYYNARYSSDVIVGEADDYGNDVVIEWGTEVNQVKKTDSFEDFNFIKFMRYLNSNGFGDIVRGAYDSSLLTNPLFYDKKTRFVVDTTGIDNIEEKINRLNELKTFLEDSHLKYTGLYQGVNEAIERYESQNDIELEAANNLIDTAITNLSISNQELSNITVNSAESFEQYRQKLIEKIKEDEDIGEMLSDGILSDDNLETSVNTFMSTCEEFSTWYDEWIKKFKNESTLGETPEVTPLSKRITSSEESLDKFQSAVKEAADAYTTLLSGNYSSSELLDSIQAITKAASDMGKSIDWESIAASGNPLQAIQDEIEAVSNTYAESVLNGAGIDVDSKFGQMLANIVQEAYKSEAALSSLNTQIDSLQSAYDDLTDIVDSYNKTGYITFDQLQTLLSIEPQYLSCLMDENGQLQLNEAAMSELANKRLDDAEAQAIQQAITELGQIALQDEKQAVQENAKAFTNAVNDLANYNSELANTIAEATVGAEVIRDLNAAINGAKVKGATDSQINTVLSNLNTKLQLIKSVRNKVATSGFGSVNKSSSGSSSKKETDWKSILDKETKLLEKQLEAGLITFDEYVRKRRDIIEKYYRDNKISAEEYYDALEDMYDYQKSIYDKVLSAVERRFEREIDKIQDVIDAIEEQNEVLEKQKDQYDSILSVVNNVYDKEIERIKAQQDAIQDTIDALQDENDERKLALQLEQAKWELYRAQHQRTKKIFNGTEFIYDTDKDAIRDAQENLADLTLEQTVDGLEKEKEALDAVIEELEKYRDLWNDISDTLENEEKEQLAIELWGKDYEKYILSNRISDIESFKNNYVSIQKQINDNKTLIDSYNEKVKYYEKLKDQWSDIADAYEHAMEDQYAAMVLGANWESNILDGRLDVLNRFKDEYIAIQNAITEAAKNSAQAQAQAQSVGSSGGSTGGANNVGTITTPITTPITTDSDKTQKYATYKHIGTGFSSNGQAQSQIVPLGGDGVVQYGNKWYVYKKIRTYNSNGEASSRIIPDGANGIIKAYASGTDHAMRGLNLVGEEGIEALIDNDGNVSLVTEPSLIPMQGGETVKNAKETEDLLNPDNIVPVDSAVENFKKAAANLDWSNIQQKLLNSMPSYSSMIQLPNMPMPSYDYSVTNRDNGVTISIGDIHLHEVQKVDTLANDIIRELPNKITQAMSRR